MKLLTLLSVLLGAGLVATTVDATTYVVRPDGTGDYSTIDRALYYCADGDLILLTDGTFRGTGNRDVSYRTKAVTVRSQSGNPAACVIDCEGSVSDHHRAFLFDGEGPSSVLEGVTIVNGYASSGAGIYCTTASPTIRNVIFSSCRASGGSGGGFGCGDSNPTLENCTFLQCTAQTGGGMFNTDGSPTLIDCTFLDCFADYGAGLYSGYGHPELTRCRFDDGFAYHGGGVYLQSAYPIFIECIFCDNFADNGGGLYSQFSTTTLFRCTIANNRTDPGSGTGIYCRESTLQMIASIIAFSIRGQSIVCIDCNELLYCCNVYGNEGGDYVDCISGYYGELGNFSLDPLFCNASSKDYSIHRSSPCMIGNHPSGTPCGLIGALPVGCPATGVDDAFGLDRFTSMDLRNLPNPFTATTEIRFHVPAQGGTDRVQLRIFDAGGRCLRTLLDGSQVAGFHTVTWDGRDERGVEQPAGIYFAAIKWDGRTASRRLLLLR